MQALEAMNSMTCPHCGHKGCYVDEDESGYYLACDGCSYPMTTNAWLDSSGPYDEALRVASSLQDGELRKA